MKWIVAILGLALLMIVHESGHYFAARASGLRVLKFSIGFGPTLFKVQPDETHWVFTAFGDRVKFKLWKHDPEKHGPTVFQVAIIPFLAYVQIAGMNPLEENDPNDKGSYANASLRARIATIIAGPLANYVVASMFFLIPFYNLGVPTEPTVVRIMPDTPAMEAGLQDGDRIMAIDGVDVSGDWDEMAARIVAKAESAATITVLRDKETLQFEVTPRIDEETGRPRIGVSPLPLRKADSWGEAAVAALTYPPMIVRETLKAIGKLVKGKQEAKLSGPTAMVNTMAKAAEVGTDEFMLLLGQISASLALFNMMPIPALDGGRLLFLGYEATTRKRPNQTVEAHIHAIGLLMLLGLMVYVTLANDLGLGGSK